LAHSDDKVDEGAMQADPEYFSEVSGEESADEEYKETRENPEIAESFQSEDEGFLQPTTISSETRLSSWSDLDLSVVVALVSPIGHWLTGGDHIKNLFLIVLLIFYLHQLIQVPWELYRASLPRRPPPNLQSHPKDAKSRVIQLAHSELRTHQGFYLLLTVFSPLIGAMFLRFVLTSVSGADQISWFSTTLFVLATGMRPWSHLLSRLRQRTQDLHDTIHYPSPESAFVATRRLQGAMKRVDTLERELKDIKGRVASNAGVEEVYEDLNGGLEDIEKVMKQNQRRADAARVSQEKRLAALEKSVAFLLEERRRTGTYPTHPSAGSGLTYVALAIPRTLWSFVTPESKSREGQILVQEKPSSKRKLDTILEDPIDDVDEEPSPSTTNYSKPVSSSMFKITVSPFSLIGLTAAAVTWPLRVFIAMFLAIQKSFS
jgi:hypothetical protein